MKSGRHAPRSRCVREQCWRYHRPYPDFAVLPSFCSASALSANPPAGVSGGANWWKTYLYSDSFHPTPYGHELLADAVAAAVRAKNWD